MSKKEMQADLLSKVILLPKPSCRKPSYGSISKTSTCNSRPSRLYELPVHRAVFPGLLFSLGSHNRHTDALVLCITEGKLRFSWK